MVLSIKRLHQHLAPRPFRYFDQLDSTQDEALSWLQDGAVSGSVVIAEGQGAGRGRSDHSWYTPPGVAIAMSIILKPDATVLPRITMLSCVSVAEVVEVLGVSNLVIKWPNDILVNDKKVSGILPEAYWDGEQLRGIVLGIGINVRVDFTDTEFVNQAISIERVLGKAVDRVELIGLLLGRIDYWLEHTDNLFDAWRSRLATIGQTVFINGIDGIVEAVNDRGALLVRDSADVQHWIYAGDVYLGKTRNE